MTEIIAKNLLLNQICNTCSGYRIVGEFVKEKIIHYKCMYRHWCGDIYAWDWREIPIEMTCKDWRGSD